MTDTNRELDARVAVARGWTWWLNIKRGRKGLFPPPNTDWIPFNFSESQVRRIEPGEVENYKRFTDWDRLGWNETTGHNSLPHYSTDIAAAWVLVEEMRQAGYDVKLQMDRYSGDRSGLTSCIAGVESDTGIMSEFIEQIYGTKEKAICHAYLEWKARE